MKCLYSRTNCNKSLYTHTTTIFLFFFKYLFDYRLSAPWFGWYILTLVLVIPCCITEKAAGFFYKHVHAVSFNWKSQVKSLFVTMRLYLGAHIFKVKNSCISNKNNIPKFYKCINAVKQTSFNSTFKLDKKGSNQATIGPLCPRACVYVCIYVCFQLLIKKRKAKLPLSQNSNII